MLRLVKALFRSLLAAPSLSVAAALPKLPMLKAMRRLNGVQLSARELAAVSSAVCRRESCAFLVFGLGNDSRFWRRLNRKGMTIFLEDDEQWLRKVTARDPKLRALRVDYGTRRSQWRELLDARDRLDMPLPAEVGSRPWDVILVDAPAGWRDDQPGRMQSIFLASRLAGEGGDVFVHDCDRTVERSYCDHYLRPENLRSEVELLRHYRLAGGG